jgi:4a-hydroxytetrahydrobiopterin dehydratase
MALLDEDAIVRALDALAWERDGAAFTKTVRLTDFAAALAYVNAVGALAEAADHHPDIDIRWNTVTLVLSTHSEGGLTDKDVTLAAAIDQIAP